MELKDYLNKLNVKEKISKDKITEILDIYRALFLNFDSKFDQKNSDQITYTIINNTLLLRKPSSVEQLEVDLYHNKDLLELSLKTQKSM